MRTTKGWFKIYRDIYDIIYDDGCARELFNFLVCSAAFVESSTKKGQILKRGQGVFSVKELIKRTGFSRYIIEKRLALLSELNLIKMTKRQQIGTLYSINDYDEFSGALANSPAIDQQFTNNSPAIDCETIKNKEIRNKKEEIYDRPFVHNFNNPIIDAWNEVFTDRPEATNMALVSLCQKRYQEQPDIEIWKTQFAKLARNEWLMRQGWFSLRWIVKSSENATKALSRALLSEDEIKEEQKIARRAKTRSEFLGLESK